MDVNEQFDASKLDQINAAADKAAAIQGKIAAGELTDLGGGRYRVETGWDRGEVIRFSTAGELVGDHGLDVLADGRAALYSRQREWFGLGQIVPDGLDDIHEVLRLIGGELEYSKQQA